LNNVCTHCHIIITLINGITKAGKSHFSRVADGLAEFVDNSIQACDAELKERKILVSFFLNHNKERHDNSGNSGFLTIADNGSGMDQKTIEQFATYSLDKATRGIMPENSKQTNIGKFGVGAKQSAFYFGDRVRVITKCKKSPKVMEFSLDRGKFEERYNNNEDVYKDEIKVRGLGDNSLVPQDERAIGVMQDALTDHEMEYENFTILVIRLHPKIVKQMLHDDKYRDLPNELAEIYHYHLHPEHTPSEITRNPKFKNAGGSSSGRSSILKKDEVPLEIICSMWLTERDSFRLNQNPEFSISLKSPDLSDPVQKCIEKAESAFKFIMNIPDPSPTENTSVPTSTQAQSRQLVR
jgi:hypothetical protein